jgi:hypothetical protein
VFTNPLVRLVVEVRVAVVRAAQMEHRALRVPQIQAAAAVVLVQEQAGDPSLVVMAVPVLSLSRFPIRLPLPSLLVLLIL